MSNTSILQYENDYNVISEANFNYTGRKRKLYIPQGINIIPSTFCNMNPYVKYIYIPKSVKYIWPHAFQKCKNLEKIYIEEGSELSDICEFAFGECGKLDYFGFENCSKLKTIGMGAFSGCNLNSIDLSDTIVHEIKAYCFSNNRIQKITFSKNIKKLGIQCFAENNIKNLTIPETIKLIPSKCFEHNIIESLAITNDITKISDKAFSDAFSTIYPLSIDMPFFFAGEVKSTSFSRDVFKIVKKKCPFLLMK